MSLSKTSIIGRLTKDPEVKQIGNDKVSVANFTVACDRDFGEGTDFYDVVVWRKLAENVGKFLGKGRLVYVDGRMQKRSYEATVPGTDVKYSRDVWEIQAEKVQFLDRADSNETPATAPSGYGQSQPQYATQQSGPAPF